MKITNEPLTQTKVDEHANKIINIYNNIFLKEVIKEKIDARICSITVAAICLKTAISLGGKKELFFKGNSVFP